MIDFFSRLDNYLKYKGLNDNKLTIETGISNGLIGKARKRGALSQDNISKILCKYIELDANWLLTGQGSMLKIDNGYPRNTPVIVNNKDVIERLERENALKDKVISGLERENQLLREARESNQDKSKPSHAVANVTGSKTELITK